MMGIIMNSHSTSAGKISIRELCLLSLMAALMTGTKLALSAIPNVHLCAVLLMLTTLLFGAKAIYTALVFCLLEGAIYGFGIWFISYVYIWSLLVVCCLPFRNTDSRLFWAVLAGLNGLSFGAQCALPYLFISGVSGAFSYWVSGIPFDIVHGVSNFVLTFMLLIPLKNLCTKLLDKLG